MTGPRSGHRRSRTPSPLLALLGSLRRTAIGPLTLGAMVLPALVTALGGLTGVVFGGSTLAASWMWLAGPSGWMLSATGPARTAVAIALSLTVTAAVPTAWLRACVTPRLIVRSGVTSVASVAPDATNVALAPPDPGARRPG
ncbi:MAG: hypothetical protein ABW212_16115, partial [Pseudonocardia sediminis]